MPKVHDLKKGSIVEIDGDPHELESLQIQTPSARGGASLYKMRFRNLKTRNKRDETLKGDYNLGNVDFQKKEVVFSYVNGDDYVFMDLSDYSEIVLSADDILGQRDYLVEDMDGLKALICDEQVFGIEIPPTVEMRIEECDPSIKGASASARTKPARCSTGLVVQVPEYLSSGESIRVDSRTGRFLGRA